MISHEEMLELKRWNTPTIYNGWEMITSHDVASTNYFNAEETRDFNEPMGPMCGRAVTVVVEPSNPEHKRRDAEAGRDTWTEYRQYVADQAGPKIVIVQDLDKPRVIGSFWGEVNSNCHRALGCIGSITDGAVRDVDEIRAMIQFGTGDAGDGDAQDSTHTNARCSSDMAVSKPHCSTAIIQPTCETPSSWASLWRQRICNVLPHTYTH